MTSPIKILTLALAFSFSINCATAQSTYTYEVAKIYTDVYILKPTISDYRWVTANIIVVVNENDVLVVDSGLLPEAATEAIKEIRKITPKPVRYLVNTHWHGDHWQGNESFKKAFPGIDIIATEQTRLALQENGLVWVNKLYPKHYGAFVDTYEKAITDKNLYGEPLSDKQVADLKIAIADVRRDVDGIKKIVPVLPNVTFSERMVISDKKREIQILYFGVANTGGDAIVFLPGEKILITGDLVVHPSPYESGMFSPEWLDVMKKMNALDYTTLLPGHGEVQHDKAYVDFLIAFFGEIISQVKAAYVTNGISSVDDLKKVVTDKSVGDKLGQVAGYKSFLEHLGPGFVQAAVTTASRRIIQGKK
ncbi:MAG TPA: MBL fold metallo-hydrolase [Cyclobacteriaceae bacterium]|nr:MBL fold metallo-hydrolase [Cyclobacteriaceae bacterium]